MEVANIQLSISSTRSILIRPQRLVEISHDRGSVLDDFNQSSGYINSFEGDNREAILLEAGRRGPWKTEARERCVT